MTKNDQRKPALHAVNVSPYFLQLDTRDTGWREDAQLVMEHRRKFIIVNCNRKYALGLEDLLEQFDYFHGFHGATLTLYCDPQGQPVFPLGMPERLFPPRSKLGRHSPLFADCA